MECITYRDGYKYQLANEYAVDIPIKPEDEIRTDYIDLSTAGRLVIKKGYAWDGPSGPTVDTANFMRGSLVHDALYQLMRQEKLNNHQYRKAADELLRTMCREDGMSSIRAWWVFRGLHWFGDPAADPANRKRPEHAPGACRHQEETPAHPV